MKITKIKINNLMLITDKVENNYTYYCRDIAENITNSLIQKNGSLSLKQLNNIDVNVIVNNNHVLQSNKSSNCNISSNRIKRRSRRSRRDRKSRNSRKKFYY